MEPWEDPDLIREYTNARFEVNDPSFVIRVGNLHPDLDAFIAQKGKSNWAFITANNPASVRYSVQANEYRNFALLDVLDDMDLMYFHGQGVCDEGDWLPEYSFLVLDISEQDCIRLGRRFGQNSIVCGEIGKPAYLLWPFKKT